jgi:hypothetical protein
VTPDQADPRSGDVVALHAKMKEAERRARHAEANLAQLQMSARDVIALNNDLRAELNRANEELRDLKAGIASMTSVLLVDRPAHPLVDEEDSEQ